MNSVFAHRLVPTCILAATAVAALVAPGAASAELGAQCSGVNVTGQGSSLQKLAQQSVWTPGFNTSADKSACNGTQGTKAKPTVTYTSTGSGAGLESWGVNGHAANYSFANAFAATDEPVNAAQKTEIEKNETKLVTEAVETVPVLQGAVAVIVHLPTGCIATSSSNKGRLVLNNSTLEGIFRGTINKWSEISDGGDKFSGSGCNAETQITRVVRFDGSGTTHIFKKYLSLISKTPFETEKGESKTWDQISEGTENTTWPKAAEVVRPPAKGGGELVKKVGETASSIGYANLADARANATFIPPIGGVNKATFWAPLQNKAGEVVTYTDPSTDKDVAKLGSANCATTEYTNGEVAFPPASVFAVWNEVTTKTSEPHYTLCGLSYVQTLHAYGAFPGTELGEATTVNNYIRFVTDSGTTGGQTLLKNHDYLGLTGTVLKEAQKGASQIAF